MIHRRPEIRLAIGFAFACVVLLLTAAVPVYSARVAADLRDRVSGLSHRLEVLNETLVLLNDAETGQRGFVITGREDFLEPYHSGVVHLERLRPELEHELSGIPGAQEHAVKLRSLMDAKLQELAETIALRRSSGFQAVEPIVSAANGKKYMDQMRVIIAQLTDAEAKRRAALQLEIAWRTDFGAYAGLAVTAVDLILLSALMYFFFRLMGERRNTMRTLREKETDLKSIVTELERRNAEISLISHMTRGLDAPAAGGETFAMIGLYCAKFWPDTSGVIYTLSNSHNVLDRQGSWGSPPSDEDAIDPQDCWALRRGLPNRTYDASGLGCTHLKREGESEAGATFCIPLIARGEVLGLLSIESKGSPGTARGLDANQESLAIAVAEQVSLSLANMRLRDELRYQSIIDPLTGLFNRRYLEETLRRELARAARQSLPFSLIVMDVDHFKRVNDLFGHDAGDAALRAIAQHLKAGVRDADVACRYGGEEFVLLLADCTKQEAGIRAEEILRHLRTVEVSRDSQPLGPLTASFGIAAYPEDGTDTEALFKAADRAMYSAKHSGRNRVALAESEAALNLIDPDLNQAG